MHPHANLSEFAEEEECRILNVTLEFNNALSGFSDCCNEFGFCVSQCGVSFENCTELFETCLLESCGEVDQNSDQSSKTAFKGQLVHHLIFYYSIYKV